MISKLKRARWIIVAAAGLLGGIGWAADRAHAVEPEGSDLQYWVDGSGGYCGGKCNPSNGSCC